MSGAESGIPRSGALQVAQLSPCSLTITNLPGVAGNNGPRVGSILGIVAAVPDEAADVNLQFVALDFLDLIICEVGAGFTVAA